MSREEIEQTFQDLSKVAIHIESVHRRKDGTTYPVEVSMGGASIQRPEGIYNAVICICQDITLRKESEEYLRYISLHDQLTGVYNRVYFDELLDDIEVRGQYPVSVLLGDLDDLKIVNDELGHVNGDDLLRKTAVLIDSSLRKEDTIARYGGDEFVVILPGTNEQSAQRVLERIQERIRHYNARKKGPAISITIGSATAYDQSIPLKQVFELADKDMYQKKQLKKLNQA
jgi:diguanylate cyclase (GGDEF)-like protein